MPVLGTGIGGKGKTGPRTKTGCFACRARHQRCDGHLPRCKRCQQAGLVCERNQMIVYDPQKLRNLEVRHESSPQPTYDQSLNHDKVNETSFLLGCFRDGIATWMDLFDYGQSYQRLLMRRTVTSDLSRASVVALAARQQSLILKQQYWIAAAEKYYGIALRHLLYAIEHNHDITETLPASVLLLSYELMGYAGQDYNRHFYGACSLIKTASMNLLQCHPLTMASYWIFFRHDVNIAFNKSCTPSLDASVWSIDRMVNDADEDALGNAALVLKSRALQLVFGTYESHGIDAKVVNLHNDLQFLHHKATADVLNFDRLMPHANVLSFYPMPAAATTQQILLSTRILLCTHNMPIQLDRKSNIIEELAQEIIDISSTKLPHSAQVQSVHALFHAAKIVKNSKSCQSVIDILTILETEVGFCSTERIAELTEIMQMT